VVITVATYAGATVGLRELRDVSARSGPEPATVSLPELVYNASETVPTTAAYGPAGPVSMVFPGSAVQVGLTGELDRPWIAVSGVDGDYRALSAPHRPPRQPGAVSVAADGGMLAWGHRSGVVLYDTVSGEVREVTGLGGQVEVGRFSPDGGLLLVHDGRLRVLETATGEVKATLDGVPGRELRQAVWTPQGDAVTFVAGEQLVRYDWRSGVGAEVPAAIAPQATLAWSPDGGQLAALRETRGVRFVDVFDVVPSGALSLARTVERPGYSIQQLLGYSGDNSVAVTALRLESGPLAAAYSMSTVDDRQPLEMTVLPGPGVNWWGPERVQYAADALLSTPAPFGEPQWPWSHLAKLVASFIFAVFVVGYWLTRPARKRRRRRAAA
jgi:hypothetical protein